MKKKTLDNNLKAAGICVAIIVIIVALSGSNIGWKVESKSVSSIKLSDVITTKLEGEPYGTGPGVPIYTISITNTFIPRMYDLPYFSICLYNSELKRSSNADAKWDITNSQFGDQSTGTMEIISGTKTANLLIFQGIRYKPIAAATAPEKTAAITATQAPEVYDQLLLFVQNAGKGYMYRDCYNLQEKDFKEAIIIPILK